MPEKTDCSRRGSHRAPRRAVSGVLLLDKPTGISSNNALQQAKWLYRAKKAGHTGSLDPLASGLLPVCFGEATKMSAYLLGAAKHYQVNCQLGVQTTTGDAEGSILKTAPVPALNRQKITAALAQFHGDIRQIPPMYSALKHQGRRLYELARKGEEVVREPRNLTIHALTLLDWGGDYLQLDVRCSKGTYVRTLVEDIAVLLGTLGHVVVLRRLGVGPYDGTSMQSLETLRAVGENRVSDNAMHALDALLLPPDSAIAHWPEVRLTADSAWYLCRGQAIVAPGAPKPGWLRLYNDETGEFLGVGEAGEDGKIAPRRLIAT